MIVNFFKGVKQLLLQSIIMIYSNTFLLIDPLISLIVFNFVTKNILFFISYILKSFKFIQL